MTDQTQTSHQTTVTRLNETPLSQHLASLMKQVELWPEKLLILHLLEWALENLAADPHWSQAVDAAAVLVSESDPEALYQNLASPQLESATTLEQAGLAILSNVVDLIPENSVPA